MTFDFLMWRSRRALKLVEISILVFQSCPQLTRRLYNFVRDPQTRILNPQNIADYAVTLADALEPIFFGGPGKAFQRVEEYSQLAANKRPWRRGRDANPRYRY